MNATFWSANSYSMATIRPGFACPFDRTYAHEPVLPLHPLFTGQLARMDRSHAPAGESEHEMTGPTRLLITGRASLIENVSSYLRAVRGWLARDLHRYVRLSVKPSLPSQS